VRTWLLQIQFLPTLTALRLHSPLHPPHAQMPGQPLLLSAITHLLIFYCREPDKNMFCWTAIDYATRQPKLVSLCVIFKSHVISEKLGAILEKIHCHFGTEEMTESGIKSAPTMVGEDISTRPKVQSSKAHTCVTINSN